MIFNEEIKIPKERVAIVIGTKGKVKREIESKTNSKLDIDSQSGEILISSEDGLMAFLARNIVQAIGRGFNPEIALNLLKDNFDFALIDISDFARNENDKIRLRSRIIGSEGRAKKNIEQLTNTKLEIYGKTVGIIGPAENIILAKRAVEMLLQGSKHGSVYHFLEKNRRIE